MIRGVRVAAGCCAIVVGAGAAAQGTAADAESVPDTMEARLQACLPCHGAQGRGVANAYFPRLAGKPAGYLFHQLTAYRDSRRKYAPMNYLLAYLPDVYLRKMADYYSQQPLPAFTPPRSPVAPEVLEHGQRLVTNGDPRRNIPACVACHGSQLNGREPGIPGLLGLRADYITSQLGAWRYGTRTSLAPDCMQLVAARLTEQDMTAVAAWLASQPVFAGLRPLAAGPERLPLECGSQRR